MTDNEKMREEFEHYVATKTLMSLEKYTSGSYKHSSTQQSWETWQAAKSVSVVGEPYLYVRSVHDGWPEYSKEDEFSDGKGGGLALYLKPTTSITNAELERLWESESACKAMREAVDFFNRVQASTDEERAAVGRDHWDWVMKEAKNCAIAGEKK